VEDDGRPRTSSEAIMEVSGKFAKRGIRGGLLKKSSPPFVKIVIFSGRRHESFRSDTFGAPTFQRFLLADRFSPPLRVPGSPPNNGNTQPFLPQ